MPEGPEVMIVTESLKRTSENKDILCFNVHLEKYKDERFEKIVPCKVREVFCRGKYIFFHLLPHKEGGREYYLHSHLKMEGRWRYSDKKEIKEHKHTHVRIELSDRYLYYDDTRKMGSFTLLTVKEGENMMGKIGKEPLKEDLDPDYFLSVMKKEGSKVIASALLDQKYIAGIGNYLKSEILYHARIHPTRRINTLNQEEILRLYLHIHRVIRSAYEYKGLTIKSYWSPENVRGRFPCIVYNKEGKQDPNGYVVKRIKQNGRSSFYVEELQL
jgi:formamidopyrimidine-DNA glycosylase